MFTLIPYPPQSKVAGSLLILSKIVPPLFPHPHLHIIYLGYALVNLVNFYFLQPLLISPPQPIFF